MKAMVLAAGLGTRLRPLTDTRPKALVEISGKTLLEIALTRLQSFGVRDVIINVHHFPGMIVDFLESKNNFGMHIGISREDDLLLDTGGGLKKAAWFFLQDSEESQHSSELEGLVGRGFSRDIKAPNPAGAFAPEADESFILHNVDVISNVDLRQMLEFHQQNNALATLMVQQRPSSRYLLFDDELMLCGRRFEKENKTEWACPSGKDCPPPRARKSKNLQTLAFGGIHIISPRLLNMFTEDGAFSIIATYLRLASAGERILAFRDDRSYWRDLGNPRSLAQAESDLRERGLR